MENRIDAALTVADRDKILDHINQIRALLPFLIGLTAEERKSLARVGDKRRAFMRDALTLAEQDDSYLPRNFDLDEMRKDVGLTEALYPILTALAQTTELIEDTYTLAGSEGYAGGLVIYQSATNNGTGGGLDDLVDTLGRSFARKSKGKPPGNDGEGQNNK